MLYLILLTLSLPFAILMSWGVHKLSDARLGFHPTIRVTKHMCESCYRHPADTRYRGIDGAVFYVCHSCILDTRPVMSGSPVMITATVTDLPRHRAVGG